MAMPLWSNGIREILTKPPLGLKMLVDWFNDFTAWISTWSNPDGSSRPVSLTDAEASNNSVYYSTTANKLVYKDNTGTVNNLY